MSVRLQKSSVQRLEEKRESSVCNVRLRKFIFACNCGSKAFHKSEMLLRSLDCADDTGISSVKKDIAAMESALKKLEAQEAKYSAELDAALKEYGGLKEQASEFDAGELMEARLSIRGEKERSAVTRVQDAYGEKYDSLMMFDSKRDVANLLHEEEEAHSVRERLRQKQQTKTQRQRKPKHYEQKW